MTRFTFRLQRVLDLRADVQRAKSIALAKASHEAQLARDARDEIAALCQQSLSSLQASTGDGSNVGSLRQLQFMLSALDARLALAESGMVTADSLMRNAQDALTTAFQARHALHTLREKQRDDHITRATAVERATMDDIALTRFHHTDSPHSDSERLTHG
jgi:flagellar export protein FliJ